MTGIAIGFGDEQQMATPQQLGYLLMRLKQLNPDRTEAEVHALLWEMEPGERSLILMRRHESDHEAALNPQPEGADGHYPDPIWGDS